MIPIGAITSIDPQDQLSKELKLNWTKSFTLLGFKIDSELNTLSENFEKRFLKVESLIIKWERRNLTTSGRVAIAKAILLSQFIYLLQTYIKGKTTKVSAKAINTSHSL